MQPISAGNYNALQLLIQHSTESPLKKQKLQKKFAKLYRHGRLSVDKVPKDMLYSLCCARLKNGDFSDYTGWEYRNPWAETFHRMKGLNRWDGSRGPVTVLGEQGLGDEIMFASVLPDLMCYVGQKNVKLECDKRLVEVMARSFRIDVRARRPLTEKFEGQVIALADLLRFFRPRLDAFPKKPYLKADPERQAYWRAWLESLGPGPYTGIAWKARHGQLDPADLSDGPGTFINLQYDADAIPAHVIFPDIDPKADFGDQLNLIAALDKVQSITQTVVHAAGALGVDCDVIKDPEGFSRNNLRHPWYYPMGMSMPWYGSVRLFQRIEQWRDHVTRKTAITK